LRTRFRELIGFSLGREYQIIAISKMSRSIVIVQIKSGVIKYVSSPYGNLILRSTIYIEKSLPSMRRRRL